ncbi:phenylacetic acid degradation operon negative regulatory protein PaaX [Aquabacter sp. CN5-332]|uniref:phenylacetic acid degradation operon negative regulatory protein PaaX n=1 Tax=Aquabacter sp. CN5-332 TaxID=3156608 RepID=UPI0032B3EC0A
MSRALTAILDHVRAEPSRTWSIIVTIYGDAIVPRGGSVWLGTLSAFFRALDISDGVVRTAMSRLASDGWLERTKVGRNSYYRLAEKGRETFQQATSHIYSQNAPAWAGHFDMLLAENGARGALEAAGFGSPAPGVWIAPGGVPVPVEADGALRLRAGGDDAANRALAARAWALEATGEAYARFLDAFSPLRAAVLGGQTLSDLDCLVGRVLLIHEYRRIVLRDPILPAEVLPADWPGAAARALCAEVYGALLEGSERWLDENAVDESGAPLPPSDEVWRRFKG